jgi:hypothetical protein
MSEELVCRRDAFSPGEEREYERLLATWRGAIESRRKLDNGLEFTLRDDDGGLRDTIEAFVPFEQRCCPFLSWEIEDAGPSKLLLRMTGPPGTDAFIEAQEGG